MYLRRTYKIIWFISDYNVEIEEVNSYAEKIGAIFKETSAKDSFGINELFEEIGNNAS